MTGKVPDADRLVVQNIRVHPLVREGLRRIAKRTGKSPGIVARELLGKAVSAALKAGGA